MTVACMGPSNNEASINVGISYWGYNVDIAPEDVDVRLAWDDGPAEFDTWTNSQTLDLEDDLSAHIISPHDSATYEDYEVFIHRLSQHSHLRIDLEGVYRAVTKLASLSPASLAPTSLLREGASPNRYPQTFPPRHPDGLLSISAR